MGTSHVGIPRVGRTWPRRPRVKEGAGWRETFKVDRDGLDGVGRLRGLFSFRLRALAGRARSCLRAASRRSTTTRISRRTAGSISSWPNRSRSCRVPVVGCVARALTVFFCCRVAKARLSVFVPTRPPSFFLLSLSWRIRTLLHRSLSPNFKRVLYTTPATPPPLPPPPRPGEGTEVQAAPRGPLQRIQGPPGVEG